MLRYRGLVPVIPLLLGICGLVFAHSGATGIVKERMDLMKSIADQMKTVGKMIKGEEEFDVNRVVIAAGAIEAYAKLVPDLFPDGPVEAPSEALPAIWQDWAKTKNLPQSPEAWCRAPCRRQADPGL